MNIPSWKRFFFGFVIVIIMTVYILNFIDIRLHLILKKYVDIEVERLTTNIINKAIHKQMVDYSYHDFLIVKKNNDGSVDKIIYDTYKINKIKNEITKNIQDLLIDIDNGNIDDYFVSDRLKIGKFKNLSNGIICDVSIGSIRNSSLFANVGPSIPIKLVFSGQISSDIDLKVKEYGINNALIEIFLVVHIKEQVIMPISSKQKTVVFREPLAIDIIKGNVPDYYGGMVK